ncbi:MAG: aldo/keto reductase, partial [Gemmatimonadetes bacterium]|nr:aldo/keto reductase [Gemmatimonadota bacterium]
MHTRPIPSTGEMLPVIGLGTWQTFDVGSDRAARAECAATLGAFLDGGGRVIDSSPMYGSSEQVVGELLAARPAGPRA